MFWVYILENTRGTFISDRPQTLMHA